MSRDAFLSLNVFSKPTNLMLLFFLPVMHNIFSSGLCCMFSIDCLQRFVNNEVGQSLWYLCTHSSVDSPRITALSVSMDQSLFMFHVTYNRLMASWGLS